MKMPRSHCENENVQFVQELAEVDGPFESPININFRDLTKLELPSLVWNRAEVCPKKMKMTNTGHTVIISGKWKCERPYLTGGPLSGKYVFSQIHFHWGQDDCKGSEHQVCGEGFPLEMHVAHFKTEYLTQECALREKDGMVVVVYLFKLQDEPNASLKKILSLLPSVKQASTSHAIDPRPILSLCNPFTDDYFMYWGSVVTSTCAHILLWIISREPFGISRDQVNEFRKIFDTSHQPICRNSRDTQPLHSRNVFHVNASKHLDDPLLPVKRVLGCYCKGSETNVSSKSAANDCSCQAYSQNQEDVEGSIVEPARERHFSGTGGKLSLHWKASLPSGCFGHQSVFVHTATIHSVPLLVKRFDSEPVGNHGCLEDLKQTKSEGDTQLRPVSRSCCFSSTKEGGRVKSRGEKRKIREKKKPFKSVRAFSHLMDSLEAIKNQTFKKLREIESINQEIKGMKPFCHETEDKRWIRKIERIISKQKRFTLKSSQGCFSELKKLARECNFDKFFDGKSYQVGDNNQKMMWLNESEMGSGTLPYAYSDKKEEEIPIMDMTSSKHLSLSKAIKFSARAQRLIQSFFEDIKESDELQETVMADLNLKKIESLCSKQAGDSNSAAILNKGYITQKMFTLGNLGDRFFTAVSSDDFDMEDSQWRGKKQPEEIIIVKQDTQSENTTDSGRTLKSETPLTEGNSLATPKAKGEQGREDAAFEVVKAPAEGGESQRRRREGKKVEEGSDSESLSSGERPQRRYSSREFGRRSSRVLRKEVEGEKLLKELQGKVQVSHRSSSNLSTDSTDTRQALLAKIYSRHSRADVWEKKSSGMFSRVSSKGLYEKSHKKQKVKNGNVDSYYSQKKTVKKRKSQRIERVASKTSWELSSTSREAPQSVVSKYKWKRMTKAKFRFELHNSNSSESTFNSALENSIISPERKKQKLEQKRAKAGKENVSQTESKENCQEHEEIGTQVGVSATSRENEETVKRENSLESEQRSFLKVPLFKSSANESGNSSRGSNKTFRASSDASGASCEERQEWKKAEESESLSQMKAELATELSKREAQVLPSPRVMGKNWSLTNVTSPRPGEISQRMFMETVDDRRQSAREVSEFRKKAKGQKVVGAKDLRSGSSNETDRRSVEDREVKEAKASGNAEKSEAQATSEVEYSVRFFTTANQIEEEVLEKAAVQEDAGKMAKRCDTEKYQFLDAGPQEAPEDLRALSQRTDSDRSLSKDAFKGDAELLFTPAEDPFSVESNDRQPSVSYSALTKTPTSRHHSAETLTSLKKTAKRKGKKRPHCCKRSSKHYIRKNSSIFRKPSKVETKQTHALNFTDEEQLKIISANVANYLKQRLVERSTEFDIERNCSFKDIEEVVYSNLVASQEKPQETPLQELSAVETPQEETSAIETLLEEAVPPETPKPAEKKEIPLVKVKGKLGKGEKKQENKEETLVITAPDEPKKEKPTSNSMKPVHNFIKRNKQMAGKYRRSATTDRPLEAKKKEEEKLKAETPPKVKPKTPKKKDKSSPQNEESHAKPVSESISPENVPKTPTTPTTPRKESRLRSPRPLKKPDSRNTKNREKSEVTEIGLGSEVERDAKAEVKKETEKGSEKKAERKVDRKGKEAEKKPEKKIEKKVEKKTEKKSEKASEKVSEKGPEKGSERGPEKGLEKGLEKVPEKVPEKGSEKGPEKKAEKVPEKVPEKVVEKVSEKISEKLPEKVPENMSQLVSDMILEKVSEKVSDSVAGKVGEKEEEREADKGEGPAAERKPQGRGGRESQGESKPAAGKEVPNQLVPRTEQDSLPSPVVVRKIPQPKKRLVPAYMMTSYLPAPIEIVESQQRKMNKYLLSMSNTNLKSYLPDMLQEAKNRKRDAKKDRKSDPVFEKELEYMIKLQMCLNEEITTNIENSMNYVKTLLSPEYPLSYCDPGSKGVVLMEMTDLDCSSSGSDLTEDISKSYLGKEMSDSKSESNRDKQVSCLKMPKESGDSGVVSPILFPEGQEDARSDSSYDCKISITLNPNAMEGEGEIQSHETFTYPGENSTSQTTIYLEGSSSQSTMARPYRKKRKENEISVEMKKKLLEILEGEIKREISIANGGSSEISSEGMTVKWEDSDGNNRSHSTESSSCDNIEMLTQISETMRQYLSDFKERGLEQIIIDKASKDDESAC